MPRSPYWGKERKRTAAKMAEIRKARKELEKGLAKIQKKFPAAAPVGKKKCAKVNKALAKQLTKWMMKGSQEEKIFLTIQKLRDKKKKNPAIAKQSDTQIRHQSEALGESAAIQMLREGLDKHNIPFNPNALVTFAGSGVFNVVYIDPPVIVVLEAKGGESQCGDRESHIYPGKVVQGSKEYLHTVADLMANSNHKDPAERAKRRAAGKTLLQNLNKNPPKIVYTGVRGGYSDTAVYDPESMFTIFC